MKNKSTDIEIRARLTANDSSALEMIWERYSTDLLAYLTSMLCSRFDAAGNAWENENSQSVEVPWMMPALRLAACIAIAFLIVQFVHLADRHSLERWQASGPDSTLTKEPDSLDSLPGLDPRMINLRRIAASSRHQVSSKDLMNYWKRLREFTDDSNSSDVGERDQSSNTFLNPWLRNPYHYSTETLKS